MGFQVSWLVPDRIMEVSTFGTITKEDIIALNDAVRRSTSPATLHILYNAAEIEHPYFYKDELLELVSVLSEDRIGWLVLTGHVSPLVHFMTTTFAAKAKLPIVRAKDRSEALDLLLELDPTLAIALVHGIA